MDLRKELPKYHFEQEVEHVIHGKGFVLEISEMGVLVRFKLNDTYFSKLFKSNCYSPGDDMITHIKPKK